MRIGKIDDYSAGVFYENKANFVLFIFKIKEKYGIHWQNISLPNLKSEIVIPVQLFCVRRNNDIYMDRGRNCLWRDSAVCIFLVDIFKMKKLLT